MVRAHPTVPSSKQVKSTAYAAHLRCTCCRRAAIGLNLSEFLHMARHIDSCARFKLRATNAITARPSTSKANLVSFSSAWGTRRKVAHWKSVRGRQQRSLEVIEEACARPSLHSFHTSFPHRRCRRV